MLILFTDLSMLSSHLPLFRWFHLLQWLLLFVLSPTCFSLACSSLDHKIQCLIGLLHLDSILNLHLKFIMLQTEVNIICVNYFSSGFLVKAATINPVVVSTLSRNIQQIIKYYAFTIHLCIHSILCSIDKVIFYSTSMKSSPVPKSVVLRQECKWR